MTGPSSHRTVPAGRLGEWFRRFLNSAVAWSWGTNVVRLGFGLFLLPLLALILSKNDLGFYYLLVPLLGIVPILDLGLATAVERNVSYAMGGARELKAHGVELAGGDGHPNYALLWRMLHAVKAYYAVVGVVGFLGLGLVGTWVVAKAAHETSNPGLSWLAWGVAVVGAGFEIYVGWWNVVLRGMNGVLTSARIVFFCHGLKLVLACAALLAGGGVVSVFAATLVSSALLRFCSKRACLALLGPCLAPRPGRTEILAILRTLWPNSWRVALQLLSNTLATYANVSFCYKTFGLAANGQYGLSIQVATVTQGVAMVWVSVKWPLIGQLRARQDHAGMRRVLWPRFWLQALTFLTAAGAAALLAEPLLRWIGTDKQFLPSPWFLVFLAHAFLELQVTFWTSLLASENRVPSLWPIVITNGVIVCLVRILAATTGLGLGVFALAPLLANLAFNSWYWPRAGARNLHTTWTRFLLSPNLAAEERKAPLSQP